MLLSSSARSLVAIRAQLRHPKSRRNVCLLCSSSTRLAAVSPKPSPILPRRRCASYATAVAPAAAATPPNIETPSQLQRQQRQQGDARKDLEQALVELGHCGSKFVNTSRLQLAILGLRETAGTERIRLGVLDFSGDGDKQTGRKVAGLLLADPLNQEEEWEGEVVGGGGIGGREPLMIQVEKQIGGKEEGRIEQKSLVKTMKVDSPIYNGCGLEVVVASARIEGKFPSKAKAEDELLDLGVGADIGGKIHLLKVPVHKLLLVGSGILTAGDAAKMSLSAGDQTSILTAVDIPGQTSLEKLPFEVLDINMAKKGLGLFRQSLQNTPQFERLWSESNLSALTSWLKSDIQPRADGQTKPAVRSLVGSILAYAKESLGLAETNPSDSAPQANAQAASVLQQALSQWAEQAHRELQDELDAAFAGKKWRKLGWWKLFWRADDVGWLTGDIISKTFLPTAERELIYLAGRIRESQPESTLPSYSQPRPSNPPPTPLSSSLSSMPPNQQSSDASTSPPPAWPRHLSFTKSYLHTQTIPSLQALAQKLVLTSASTIALTSSLSGLLYVSASVSSMYEAGAVAALGAVWSLYRMQTKWGAARRFWEGEVREEGRKAVRGAEMSVGEVLEGTTSGDDTVDANSETERVGAIIERAEEALARMK